MYLCQLQLISSRVLHNYITDNLTVIYPSCQYGKKGGMFQSGNRGMGGFAGSY